MTIILNDPSLWPLVSYVRQWNYFQVACLTAVVYDWVLTFGQEFELVWRQRWSLMTFLYLSAIHGNTIHNCHHAARSPGPVDRCSVILYFVQDWVSVIVNSMLGVIIITRLYAMSQRSRQMLICLVVIFLAIRIISVVFTARSIGNISGVEYDVSGTYMCGYDYQGDISLLSEITWILTTAWETLALCLAIWIAVQHFRELRGASTGWTARDCFAVLVKSHVFYFASFVAVSSLQLSDFSPQLLYSTSAVKGVFVGVIQFTRVVQTFILGPRLILGVREYHANLVAKSDEGTAMTSIAFQERMHISTGSGV